MTTARARAAPLAPKILAAAVGTALAAAIAWPLYLEYRGGYAVVHTGDVAETPWRGDRAYAVDAEVGHRQARDVTVEFTMGAIGGQPARIVRRSNNHGFLGETDLPDPIPGPRIVILGDSHTMGVVATADNVGLVLQDRLRTAHGVPGAHVLNAAAGHYSLYQYLLRARQLLPRYAPQVLVTVVFLGNDFLELEDVARPHVDDDLVERPASPHPPPETTTERLRRLALPKAGEAAFWQGLNQATYLHLRPERRQPILRKARFVVDQLARLTRAHGTRWVAVVLPPFDLVFPEYAPAGGAFAAEVVASGVQRDLHTQFLALLREAGVECVDLLPVFVGIGAHDLYATDFHIHVRGHSVAAAELAPVVARLLQR